MKGHQQLLWEEIYRESTLANDLAAALAGAQRQPAGCIPSMLLLVTGSRAYPDREQARRVLRSAMVIHNVMLIHGGAPGIDAWADEVGNELGFGRDVVPASSNPQNYLVLPPDRPELERRLAGIPRIAWPTLRNTELLRRLVRNANRGMRKRVYGFWDGVSRGTLDCLDKAVEAGVATSVVMPGRSEPLYEWPADQDAMARWDAADRDNPLRWEHRRTKVETLLRSML